MSQGSKNHTTVYGQEKEIQWHINTGSNKIHAKRLPGRFRQLKWMAASVWLLFFLGPYLRWGERQAVLLDIPNRQFHFFDLTVHPQDVWTLTFVMLFFATLLFMSTVLAGRAFCGYACFQTVWTDVFTWLENTLEGPPKSRFQLDAAPWNARKLSIKTIKHMLWILIAILTGVSFAAWFTDAFQLWRDYFTLQAHISAWIVLILFTTGTYVFAGFMREQVCMWLCPYARIQGVMYDKNTLLPAYDEQRGEPRGNIDKSVAKFSGACVDCDQCLAVCPTGIDIREGQQVGCITCGLCIDACDMVMNKLKQPIGLIRYASLNQLNGHSGKPMFQRAPVWLAIVLIISSIISTIYGLNTMSEAELSVIDSRKPMYVLMSDNSIQNRFQIRIFNKSKQNQRYHINVNGITEMRVEGTQKPLLVKSGKMATTTVTVRVKKDAIRQSLTPLIFNIRNTNAADAQPIEYKSMFKGPVT